MTENTQWLRQALEAYHPTQEGLTAYERVYKQLMLRLLQTNPRCFWRDDFQPGHITGSILVASMDYSKVLLMHHPKLNIWLQFGGHCDGDGHVHGVAMRELQEEAGYGAAMVQSSPDIFDLDIQSIPARKDEPEHLHFDVRFLARVDERMPIPGSDENIEMRWFDLDEVERVVTAGHGRWRMIQKLKLMRA